MSHLSQALRLRAVSTPRKRRFRLLKVPSPVTQNGGYSESNKHRRVEDYELWVRMYKAGYKGYNLQETLYDMYDAESAMKRRSFSNRVNESRVIFKACRAAKSIKYYRVALPLIKWLVPSSVYKNTHMKQKD